VKVTLVRHGGFAAGIRWPTRLVDSATLPEPAAAELARLVSDLQASPAPAGDRPGRARDAMSYTLTLEDANGEQTISQTDTTMTPQFASLIDWIDRRAKASGSR
jgi:hypothetical protein